MEPVTISGEYSADDLVSARFYMTRRNPWMRIVRFLPMLIPVVLSIVIVIARRGRPVTDILIVLLVSAMIAGVGMMISRFISRPIQVFLTRRQMNSMPSLKEKKTFRFDLRGLSWEQTSSQGSFDWMAALLVEENRDGFFIFSGKNVAHFIPRRFFADSEELVRVREIIAAGLPGRTKFLTD